MNLFDTIPEAKGEYKERIFRTADFAVSLSEKARRAGILSLEEHTGGWSEDYGTELPPLTTPALDAEDFYDEATYIRPFAAGGIEETLFRRMLMMVLDGFDAENIADIARYTLASARNEDDETRLSLMIGAEGILSLQRGDNPRMTIILLSSMMGRALCEEYCKTRLKD